MSRAEAVLTWLLLIGGTAALAFGFHHQNTVCASLGYVCLVLGAFALGEQVKQRD